MKTCIPTSEIFLAAAQSTRSLTAARPTRVIHCAFTSRARPGWPISWSAPTSPLFRKDPQKAARQEAAKAEIKRLRALSTDELAVQMLPAMGVAGRSMRPQELCDHLLRDFPDARQLDVLDLLAPVRRALLKLDDAGLIEPIWHQRSPVWRISELGEKVLAEDTVEQRLQG